MRIVIYKVPLWKTLFIRNYSFNILDRVGNIIAISAVDYEFLEDCEKAALFIKLCSGKSKIEYDFNRDED